MGEAKKRGSFEQRRALAVGGNPILDPKEEAALDHKYYAARRAYKMCSRPIAVCGPFPSPMDVCIAMGVLATMSRRSRYL